MGERKHERYNTMLKYSQANAKTHAMAAVPELAAYLEGKRKIYSLDLLSGYSCPFARECLSKVVEVDGKRRINDGPDTQFRCFSASQEAQYPNVYNARKHNYDLLRDADGIMEKYDLLSESMPKNLGICRIHVAGDFFNSDYFSAWIAIASENPDRLFYAYTKSLKYWVAMEEWIPHNLVLTASYGGRNDELIATKGLRSAIVVFQKKKPSDSGPKLTTMIRTQPVPA